MVKDSPKFKLPDRAIGLSELSDMVLEACKKKNSTKYLEAVISSSDAILLDEPYVEILKHVAALKDKDVQQRMFIKLISKNFSASSLRSHLEEKLSIEEVVKIGNLAMDTLCRCSVNRNEEFLNALDLCNLIFNCHFQKFVWHKSYRDSINGMISSLKDMAEICCQFTNIESVSKLRADMPALLAPPRSDYFLERYTMESVQL